MIDSHCHLSQVDYNMPLADLIQSAEEHGVKKMLNIACDTKDWEELFQVTKQYRKVNGAIGIHPEYALREEGKFLERLPEIFSTNPKLLAVGEIGLDYSEKDIPPDKQQELFNHQIHIANQINKPVIIHTRGADIDTINILEKAYQAGELKNSGIIHCYSGTLELAKKTLEMGFYISISGIVTFKSAAILRENIKEIPLNRLLVETDCPWLAPEPFRGRKNQPAYVVKTLEKVAELKGVSVPDMDRITTENFERLFKGVK